MTTVESTATLACEEFQVGDEVVVLTTGFPDATSPGDRGVVHDIGEPYVGVRFEDGLRFPFRPDEIGLVPATQTVSDDELVGATVEDVEALYALPMGTVIVAENTGAIAHRIGEEWVTPMGTEVTGLVVLGVVLGAVVRVAYVPSS